MLIAVINILIGTQLTSMVLDQQSVSRQPSLNWLIYINLKVVDCEPAVSRDVNRESIEDINRPFPSSLVPLFHSESKCEIILMKMTLICMKMKLHTCRTHFHKKGFAVRLVLKERDKGTQTYWHSMAEVFSTHDLMDVHDYSSLEINWFLSALAFTEISFLHFLNMGPGVWCRGGGFLVDVSVVVDSSHLWCPFPCMYPLG